MHHADLPARVSHKVSLRGAVGCALGVYLVVVTIALQPGKSVASELDVDLGPVTEKHVMVPMRDGKRLSAYIYFPRGKGPWPAIFEQRYTNNRAPHTRQFYARLAAQGYGVMIENFRGSQLSEGVWVGSRALGWGSLQDGYDTVEWLAKQPWCNGRVGSFGGSQGGFAQNFLAVTQAPHLVCQYMRDTGLSLFHEGYRIGGTTRPLRFKSMEAVARDPAHNRTLIEEWLEHPTYDDYWEQEDCTRHFAKMNVPCFQVGSWYDFMCRGTVESFVGRQHRGGPRSRGRQQMRIGPWVHGRNKNINRVGELTFPADAKFDKEAHMIRWFDHHLKGLDNGIDREPAVQYYVLGAVGEPGAPGNEWRRADDWPPAAQPTAYYMHSAGRLSTDEPRRTGGDTISFRADPYHPATLPSTAFPGARDARPFERQREVRTLTTDALTAPVEWTGKVIAELFVSSTARDTDFIVRVSDVYPDGRSILIIDGILRARYREGFEKETFMEPGKIYKLTFDVGWLSQIFNRGHCIRVTLASTGTPFFEVNPNTGERLTVDLPEAMVVATNTVYLGGRYPSRVVAPVAAAAR